MPPPPDRFTGILIGLAVGDALGTTLEFQPRRPLNNLHTEMTGGGVFRLAPGQWTDDTAMAIALGRSLQKESAFRPLDILSEWTAWYRTGKHSCTGTCFDIGNATRAALQEYEHNPAAVPSIDPSALGNAPLMRLAPVVLFSANEEEAGSLAYQQAALTHGEEAANAADWFARLLFRTAANGHTADAIPMEIASRRRDAVSASGFYKDTLEAALWAVSTTATFEDALIQAVNLGGDADTIGAVTGQLAGAIYGEPAIPPRWLEPLAWRHELRELAASLLTR